MKRALVIILLFGLFSGAAFADSVNIGGGIFSNNNSGISGNTGGGGQDALSLPNPLKADSIPQLIGQVFKTLAYYVAPPLAALMIVWGAILMLTSGGDPAKFESGVKTIKYTIGGLVVVLLGTLIGQLVAELLGAPKSVTDAFRSLGP